MMSRSKERLLSMLRSASGHDFQRIQKLIMDMSEEDSRAMMLTVQRTIESAKREGKSQALRQVRRGGMAQLYRR